MHDASRISSLELHDGVAVLTIDSPPVNALSHAVRIAIADGVAAAMADPATRAFILICGGRTFFAGADISELGRPIRAGAKALKSATVSLFTINPVRVVTNH